MLGGSVGGAEVGMVVMGGRRMVVVGGIRIVVVGGGVAGGDVVMITGVGTSNSTPTSKETHSSMSVKSMFYHSR